MAIKLTQVDAFTGIPFNGNPAAVCLLENARDSDWMQKVALEMNLSETAFLHPAEDGYHLRWFTPQSEVKLCGHATLASAHVLWEQGLVQKKENIDFHSLSGKLTASRNGKYIELNFPSRPAVEAPEPQGLCKALGVTPQWVGRSAEDYLVQVATVQEVEEAQPDFSALKKVNCRGISLTARADSQPYDFVSRFFAPACGVDEDPATGSAHCTLAPFWQPKIGVNRMRAYQASQRTGAFKLRLEADRVFLGGQAVTTAHIHLLV